MQDLVIESSQQGGKALLAQNTSPMEAEVFFELNRTGIDLLKQDFSQGSLIAGVVSFGGDAYIAIVANAGDTAVVMSYPEPIPFQTMLMMDNKGKMQLSEVLHQFVSHFISTISQG